MLQVPEAERPFSWRGHASLAVLGLAMGLWITSGLHGVGPGAIGLLAVALLSAIGTLEQRDVNAVDWSVLILMWGGLSLSVAMEASGLAGVLAAADVSGWSGGLWLTAAAAPY